MSKKDYSIEELLEIAESSNQRSHFQEKTTDVDKYIKAYNIQAGTTKVPCYIIYYHYRKWRKRKYMAKNHFFHYFSHTFERCLTSADRSYYLDPEPFDMTLEGSLRARGFLRKEKNVRQKKEKSKS